MTGNVSGDRVVSQTGRCVSVPADLYLHSFTITLCQDPSLLRSNFIIPAIHRTMAATGQREIQGWGEGLKRFYTSISTHTLPAIAVLSL